MKTVLVHNLQYGGAYRRLAEQLAQLDMPVTEVTLEGAKPLTVDAIIVPLTYRGDESRPSIRPFTRHLDLLSLLTSYHQVYATVRDLDPDVVWLNNCRYLNAPRLPTDLARRAVYHCDEPRRADYEESVRQSMRSRTRVPYWPMRQVMRRLDRAAVASVAAVTTNSTYSVGQIRLAYRREAVVIPCGVSPLFRPPPEPVLRDHLLSVGSLIPSKGHDLAIEAAGRSGLGLPLIVVAPRADDREEERLRRIASDSGIELRVRCAVSDNELIALYQSALVTLYMAEAEPFGLVSIEAQSCGSPVIVSDEGGLPETLVSGTTGWAVPRRVEQIAERLAQFNDAALAEKFGEAAANDATRWCWSASAQQLRTVLESVARR